MRFQRTFVVLIAALTLGFCFSSTASAASQLSWSEPEQINVGSAGHLNDVTCPNKNLCIGVGGEGGLATGKGIIVTSTNPTGGAGAWAVTHVSTGHYLYYITCPMANLCVAIGEEGTLATSTNPAGGGSTWTVTQLEGYSVFFGLSCSSEPVCVIVPGGPGELITSTNPTGGAAAWNVIHVSGVSYLSGVSCVATHTCVVIGAASDELLTSTNPTGGAGAWSVTHVEGTNLEEAITCPLSNLCIAPGQIDELATTTNPTGGASAWNVTHVDGNPIRTISCSIALLCAGVNEDGEAYTTTNPTGGASAWAGSEVVDTTTEPYLDGVSCTGTVLCVTVDYNGYVVVGTPAVLPVNTGLPVTSGVAQVGQTLSCSPGSWSGSPESYTYQWMRFGAEIVGATGSSYTAQPADQGFTLTCVVTAHNPAGSSSPATSAPTQTVQEAPVTPPSSEAKKVIPPEIKPEEPPLVTAKCMVPKLKGKTLAKAKKLLVLSHCKLGKVTTTKTGGNLKVVSQKPGAGRVLRSGFKVAVQLG